MSSGWRCTGPSSGPWSCSKIPSGATLVETRLEAAWRLAFLADGRLVALLSSGPALVFDRAGERATLFDAAANGGRPLEVSPDGRRVAVAVHDELHLLEVATGGQVARTSIGLTSLGLDAGGGIALGLTPGEHPDAIAWSIDAGKTRTLASDVLGRASLPPPYDVAFVAPAESPWGWWAWISVAGPGSNHLAPAIVRLRCRRADAGRSRRPRRRLRGAPGPGGRLRTGPMVCPSRRRCWASTPAARGSSDSREAAACSPGTCGRGCWSNRWPRGRNPPRGRRGRHRANPGCGHGRRRAGAARSESPHRSGAGVRRVRGLGRRHPPVRVHLEHALDRPSPGPRLDPAHVAPARGRLGRVPRWLAPRRAG